MTPFGSALYTNTDFVTPYNGQVRFRVRKPSTQSEISTSQHNSRSTQAQAATRHGAAKPEACNSSGCGGARGARALYRGSHHDRGEREAVARKAHDHA